MLRAETNSAGRHSGVRASLLAVGLAMIAALTCSGCGRLRRSGYTSVPTVDARQVERLRRTGERDMRCPRTALVMIPLTQNAVELRGCERIREYSLVCRRGRRCNWHPMTPAALLAMRDLACPLEAMSVSAPSAGTRDLIGCGRVGRYAIQCAEDAICRWNLLGPATPDVVVPPPSAYGTTYAPPPTIATPAPAMASVDTTEVPPPPGATVAPGTSFAVEVQVGEVPPPPPGSTAP